MALGEQRKVRAPDQIVFPVAPCFDLTVDIGKPLFGIEGINDIVGVLEQIFEILLGFFNFSGALSVRYVPAPLCTSLTAVQAVSDR